MRNKNRQFLFGSLVCGFLFFGFGAARADDGKDALNAHIHALAKKLAADPRYAKIGSCVPDSRYVAGALADVKVFDDWYATNGGRLGKTAKFRYLDSLKAAKFFVGQFSGDLVTMAANISKARAALVLADEAYEDENYDDALTNRFEAYGAYEMFKSDQEMDYDWKSGLDLAFSFLQQIIDDYDSQIVHWDWESTWDSMSSWFRSGIS